MLTTILALALLGQCSPGGSCAIPARTYQPAAAFQPLAPVAYQPAPTYRRSYVPPTSTYVRPRGVFGRLFRR